MAPDMFDRAAAVRAALRSLVADRGFHGASMGAVARTAGVAAGTAYTHYASKDELVVASYLEVRSSLIECVTAAAQTASRPQARFLAMWLAMADHLQAHPEHARFIQQVDASPYADEAHRRAGAHLEDPFVREAAREDMAELLAPLPADVVSDLAFGPLVRLCAAGRMPDGEARTTLAVACWRAITVAR